MIKNVKVRKSIPKPYNDYVDYINKTLLPPKQFKFSAIDLFAGCGGLSRI